MSGVMLMFAALPYRYSSTLGIPF